MADRLPFGQVTPTARPIGAFIQPGQLNTAGPARPFDLPALRGIDTIQQGGTTNVQGVNQFQQLATALEPFSKGVTEVAADAYLGGARAKIEEGYYAELRNQAAKASASLQIQAEIGAANAASAIGTLQKRDPEAAQLLKESNPWALIGRRRAVAQRIAAGIDDEFENDLAVSGGALAQLPPGHPALKARQVDIAQRMFKQYGLQGDESEVSFYVTPSLNRAMDNYAEKQRKLYSAAVEDSTMAAVTAGLGTAIRSAASQPFSYNGQTYKAGSFEHRELNARLITEQVLDPAMRLLDPEARKRVLAYAREQVISTYGNDPLALGLIKSLRAGDASLPYEKRPAWGEAMPLQIMELQGKGMKVALDNYQMRQQGMQPELDKLWMGTNDAPGPGAFMDPESDPRYPGAVKRFASAATAMGYADVPGYIVRKSNQQSELGEILSPADPFVAEDFATEVGKLSPGVWTDDPNAYANLQREAKAISMREPTREKRRQTYQQLMGQIDKARAAAGELDGETKAFIENQTSQELDSQDVREILKKQKGSQAGNALMNAQRAPGTSVVEAAAAAYRNPKVTAHLNRFRDLLTRAVSRRIDQWKSDNPDKKLGFGAKNVLLAGAAADLRKGDDYAQSIVTLTGRRPGIVGKGDPVGTNPSAAKGVPKEAARNLSDQQVRSYTRVPTMTPRWVSSELQQLERGRPLSAELKGLARRAGVTPLQYLRQNLFHWTRSKDGNGNVPKAEKTLRYLDQQIQKQRGARTVAGNQISSVLSFAEGALARTVGDPGGWLVSWIAPPAAASSMPTILPPGGGMGGQLSGVSGSFERPVSVVFERPGPRNQPGVDFYFLSKRFPAVLGGRVKDVSREPGYGNYVVIESVDPRNGQKVDVLYGHLADGGVHVRPGDFVASGQIVGRQGGTGRVVSQDGTIASVDFLAPAPAGSKSKAAYRDFDGLRRHVASVLQSGGGGQSGNVGAFRAAIIGKESSGDYGAVNPDSKALGIGQVMPYNVAPWTQRYLGRRLTPQQFLADRNAQDAVINGRFRDMLAEQQAAGFSGEIAIRRAAAVWYSGQAKLWNDTRPQRYGNGNYPSVAEYTKAIWESYKRNSGRS